MGLPLPLYLYIFPFNYLRSDRAPFNNGTVIALADSGCQGGENDRFLRAPMQLLPIINRLRAKMGTGEDLRPHAQWP